MDLHKICQENDPVIEAEFQELYTGAPVAQQAHLLEFANFVVNKGALAVNMRPMVLLDFLVNQKLLNIHEWAANVSARGGITKEEALREKLGPYFARRVAFDGAFENGVAFRYGALNAGGLGASRYGEFCAVFLHPNVVGKCRVAYLKFDSLNSYVDVVRSIVDHVKLSADSASESCKHYLAAVKLSADIAGLPKEEWAEAICNSRDYVEVVLLGNLAPTDVDVVRIDHDDFDLYWEYAYNEFREKLSELDRYRVDSFAQIDEQLNAVGIRWEPVDVA